MNALEELLTYPRFGEKGVIERMEKLVKGLDMVPTIKVVGSNGKGTTAHMMADMCQRLGKKVGLYTSPHLLRLGERIKINGKEIEERELNYILKWALERTKGVKGVGRFEVFTLAALYHFTQCAVDVAIMEIGLGGRYDPVKVARGSISVLTSIDLEHTQILGDTVEEIAAEKAAVCKPGDLLISAVPDIKHVVEEGVTYVDVSKPALDPLQSNARLAAMAVQTFFGLEETPQTYGVRVSGRLHKVNMAPPVYIDVAHSAKAIEVVLNQFKGQKITLVCAMRLDKKIEQNLGEVEHLITLQFSEAMHGAEELLDSFDAKTKNTALSLEEALRQAEACSGEGIILCLGGFELAGRVLAHYRNVHYDVISL